MTRSQSHDQPYFPVRSIVMLLVALLLTCANSVSAVAQDENRIAMTKSEVITDALAYSTMGNHQKAMELLEELNKAYPNDMEVKVQYFKRVQSRSNQLVTSGNKKEGYEMYKRAASLVRELAADYGSKGGATEDQLKQFKSQYAHLMYNEACAFALEGENEKCISSLREAMQWGFNNVKHMLNDLDLLEVADSEEFKNLLGEDLVKYKVALKESAMERLKNFKTTKFDIELPNLEGKIVKASDYRGKVLVITFWSTGNGPSRNNLAMLERFQRNIDDKDIAILGIGCERTKEAEDALQQLISYVENNEVTLECLMAPPAVRIKLKKNQGFPATMILNREGELKMALPGVMQYHVLATFTEIIADGEIDENPDSEANSDERDTAGDGN